MDLRRRSKNRVVEAMARIVALLPIGQEPARPNCGVDIDRVDSVPEGCNESVKPLMQRVSPSRIAMANFFPSLRKQRSEVRRTPATPIPAAVAPPPAYPRATRPS
jgi:hypothetical protein